VDLSPPAFLRGRVLAAALARRPAGRARPSAPAADPLVVFGHQAAAVADELDAVAPAEWAAVVEPYGWTVHGLAGHLVGGEHYLGSVLGLWPFEAVCAETDHIGLTRPWIARTDQRDPRATVAEWRELVGAVTDELHRRGPGAWTDRVTFHGYPFSLGAVLLAKAFELWTHADDLRLARGRPLVVPAPDELTAMADLSLRILFPATLVTAPHQSARSARFVLTGPGGGVWRLGAPEEGPAADVHVVVDIVDWCRLVAGRISPGRLQADVSGDTQLARDLFVAAQLLAA
jgi:uncharacterized protein (TIGR03083 family)